MSAQITGDDFRALQSCVPEYMLEGLMLYVERGVRPGAFLYHILCNDFIAAAMHADPANRAAMYQWAVAMYHYVPASCQGSREAVEDWIESHLSVDANAN